MKIRKILAGLFFILPLLAHAEPRNIHKRGLSTALEGCKKENTTVVCNFNIIQEGKDGNVSMDSSIAYDESGREYKASKRTISDKSVTNFNVVKFIVADIKTPMQTTYEVPKEVHKFTLIRMQISGQEIKYRSIDF